MRKREREREREKEKERKSAKEDFYIGYTVTGMMLNYLPVLL